MGSEVPVTKDVQQDIEQKNVPKLNVDVLNLYSQDSGNTAKWNNDRQQINATMHAQGILPGLDITDVDSKTGRVVYESQKDYGGGKMKFELDGQGEIAQVTDQKGDVWKKNQQGSWAEYDKDGNAVIDKTTGQPVTSNSRVGFDKDGNYIIANPDTKTAEVYNPGGNIQVHDISGVPPSYLGDVKPGEAHQNQDGTWTVARQGEPAKTYDPTGKPIPTSQSGSADR